ncbi:MAG: metallophosphoesterase [Myxococcales bacterium]|nr:metallophosphoesterase [Myxococcales bacterium]
MERTTFFTSDHHFGHANIIRYCARPFAHADAMDEALIKRWNERVGDDDVVYHLGDFTLRNKRFARLMFSRLRGRVRVLGLPWHHDSGWVPTRPGPSDDYYSASGHAVEILPPMIVLRRSVPGQSRRVPVTLSHYPLAEWEAKHHGAWHLHGHSHGTHSGPGYKLDVGVDCCGYAPLTEDEIAARMATLPPLPKPARREAS